MVFTQSPSVCSNTNASEEFHFHSRNIQQNQVNFDLLKSLIRQCEESHSLCTSGFNGLAFNSRPRRLIHCKTRTIVENGNKSSRYATLSYVWGALDELQISTLTTPKMQLHEELPRTIEDALTTALNLDIEYLWVDRYCINQNSIEDIKAEVGSMADIFSRATVTLVSLGQNAATGLPGISLPRSAQSTVRSGDCLVSPILPDLSTYVRDSEWRTRGWTYQERFLSTRCLFFTSTEVFTSALRAYLPRACAALILVPFQ
jgi:Heterokaryon incompatibility protein (HET)